jgi:DNA-binding transcriptional LysR family regulator
MNNIKNLSSLLIFAEVAKQQSFTLAAKKFSMSKSAVSQHIKRLEHSTQQQLLSRHTRGMSLTTAGEKLLSRCELLKDQVDLAFEELTKNKETPSGTFTITIPHACEKDIVIPALSQLCLEFPKLQPELLVSDQSKDLIENNLDVAIYAGELKDSNYRALPIITTSEVFCATPAFVKQHGDVVVPRDLLKTNVIATSWQKNSIDIYHNDLTKKETINVPFYARTNTLPSALEMVCKNMGIALLPTFVIQPAITAGQLVRVLPNFQGQLWPFYMVHRFHGDKPIHVTRFYQLIKHYFLKANS